MTCELPRTPVLELSADQAFMELEELCSSEDPVIYRGEETTPNDVWYKTQSEGRIHGPAKDVRISFWGVSGGKTKLIRGSNLSRMVADRRQLYAEKAKPKRKVEDMLDDPRFTLRQWRDMIDGLIEKHGAEAVMSTDGGYNNVTLRIEKP